MEERLKKQEEEDRKRWEAEAARQRELDKKTEIDQEIEDLEERDDETEGFMTLPDDYGWGPEWGMDCKCDTEYIKKQSKPGGSWQFWLECPDCGLRSLTAFMTQSQLNQFGSPLRMRALTDSEAA